MADVPVGRRLLTQSTVSGGRAHSGAGLKPFEWALLALSEGAAPLPSLVASPPTEPLPWDTLPASVHPAAAGVPPSRLTRKCAQISSMVNISRLLLAAPDGGAQPPARLAPAGPASLSRRHIVDFGGGTGALALPLAASLPDCDVTIVDMSAHSLVRAAAGRVCACRACGVARRHGPFPCRCRLRRRHARLRPLRARGCCCCCWAAAAPGRPRETRPAVPPQAIARRRADDAGLSNLRTLVADIADFSEPFDLGVSLHACGEATDLALRACAEARARFAHCPCCVGKIARGRKNNVTFNATGSYGGQTTTKQLRRGRIRLGRVRLQGRAPPPSIPWLFSWSPPPHIHTTRAQPCPAVSSPQVGPVKVRCRFRRRTSALGSSAL
eukprot:scaffold13162_cov82-Isochrysis_galbana.AAC.1